MGNCNSMESVTYKVIPFMSDRVEMLHARYINQNFSKHMHEDYAVGIIEQGAMGFRYRGSDLVASKGVINLVVPGEVHDGHAASDEGWTYRMFYLSPETLLKVAGQISEKPVQPHFREGVLDDSNFACDILRVHRIIGDGCFCSLERETRLLKLLISWIVRHADEHRDFHQIREEHRAVAVAREYIEDCYDQDINLDDLSRLGNLSHFHFIRVFEKELGITPHAYLMQTRVSRAKSMLPSSKRLADISARCGFYDQSHLTRHFRRQFGITPGKYRNFIQNN